MTIDRYLTFERRRLGAGRLGAMLPDWHVIEINLYIVGVKIVIITKLQWRIRFLMALQ